MIEVKVHAISDVESPKPDSDARYHDVASPQLTAPESAQRLRQFVDILLQNFKRTEGVPPRIQQLLNRLDKTVSDTWQELLLRSKQEYHPSGQSRRKRLSTYERPIWSHKDFLRLYLQNHFWVELSNNLNQQNFFSELFTTLQIANDLQQAIQTFYQHFYEKRNTRQKSQLGDNLSGFELEKKHGVFARLMLYFSLFALAGVFGSTAVSAQEGQEFIEQVREKLSRLETEPTEAFLAAYEAGNAYASDFTIETNSGTFTFFETVTQIEKDIQSGILGGSLMQNAADVMGISPDEVAQLMIGYFSGFLGLEQDDLNTAFFNAQLATVLSDEQLPVVCGEGTGGCFHPLIPGELPPGLQMSVDGIVVLPMSTYVEAVAHEFDHNWGPFEVYQQTTTSWNEESGMSVVQFLSRSERVLVMETADKSHAMAFDLFKLNEVMAEVYAQILTQFLGYSIDYMYGSVRSEYNDLKRAAFAYLAEYEHRDAMQRLVKAAQNFGSEGNLQEIVSVLGEAVLATTPNFLDGFLQNGYPGGEYSSSGYILNSPDLPYILAGLSKNEQAGLILLLELTNVTREASYSAGFEHSDQRDTVYLPTHDEQGNLTFEVKDVFTVFIDSLIESRLTENGSQVALEQLSYRFGDTTAEFQQDQIEVMMQEFLATGRIDNPLMSDFKKLSLVIEQLSPDLYPGRSINNEISRAMQTLDFESVPADPSNVGYEVVIDTPFAKVANAFVTVKVLNTVIDNSDPDWLLNAVIATQRTIFDGIGSIEYPFSDKGDFIESYENSITFNVFDLENGNSGATTSLLVWFTENSDESAANFLPVNTSIVPDFFAQLNLYLQMDAAQRVRLLDSSEAFSLLRWAPREQLDIIVAALDSKDSVYSLNFLSTGNATNMSLISLLGKILRENGNYLPSSEAQTLLTQTPASYIAERWEDTVYGFSFWQTVLYGLPVQGSIQTNTIAIEYDDQTNVLNLGKLRDFGTEDYYTTPLLPLLGMRYEGDEGLRSDANG